MLSTTRKAIGAIMMIEVAGCRCNMCNGAYYYCPYSSIINTIENHRKYNRNRKDIMQSFIYCVNRWGTDGSTAVKYLLRTYPEYEGLWNVVRLLK